MKHRIKVHNGTKISEFVAGDGTNLLKFLRDKDITVPAPCGGHGKCGKCVVRLGDVKPQEVSASERKKLGEKAVSEGYRLACEIKISADMEVFLGKNREKAKVATEGKRRKVKLFPNISKRPVTLDLPSLRDQRPDDERIGGASGVEDLSLLRLLPEILRKDGCRVTLLYNDGKIVGVEPGDTTDRLYGLAVDIGTTTMAGYLLDLNTGERHATYSCLNPQVKFGADVISRIKHTLDSSDGLEEMHATIKSGIDKMIKNLTEKAGISAEDVYEAVFVGNTVMMHFLLKLPAGNIAMAPFIPVSTGKHEIKASEIGIGINPGAIAVAVPSVAAYIGADTVSAILASGMHIDDKWSLLVDLGTNGEIVLGSRKRMLACSAAAGPAFEGANIRNGTGGIAGAIDSFDPKGFTFTTIGGEKPLGICGSGLVGIISGLYGAGIIDETGRLDASGDSAPQQKITDLDGVKAFLISPASENECDGDIAITQKDVRELQNAKAAISAGIKVLAKRLGIGIEDIKRVYIAGGFGSFINIESALNIGLIPEKLAGRIEAIGNAAGMGAVNMLLSKKQLHEAGRIKEKLEYVELSSCKEFNDFYIDSLTFSEEE